MSKSKTDPKRKQNLETYKTKHKKMSKEANNQLQEMAQKMPPVRNVPIWSQDTKIEVMGYEWEAIQNSLASLTLAQQAVQSVMSRNIVTGVIKMDFQKLNPQTLQYEDMTPDEKAPHAADFNTMLEGFKNQVGSQTTGSNQADGEKVSLLGADGQPIDPTSDEATDEQLEALANESYAAGQVVAVEDTGAKVIKMQPAPSK